MPSYDPSLFNINPYYDDFNEDKKFLRMLFRPGYSVQSRELTQLQTILQNQIERFGNHIFKDGSKIIGGEISTQTLNFVRIQPATYTAPIFTISASDIVGHNLIQRNGNGDIQVKAKVIDYKESYGETDPYGIAVISYLSGSQFTAGATLECTNPDKIVAVKIPTNAETQASATHTGTCRVVGVNEGIYYISGFFVKSTSQFEPAYTVSNGIRQFATPSGWMGFDVVSTIVTDKEDYTIKDPASGSYNYNAPGAHRYKIDLVLKFVETLSGEDFIDLVRYENGLIVGKNEETEYSELVKLFAERTYDESGNYIAKPFDISFRDSGGQTLHADIGSGKAYVFGYEYESKFKDVIDIPKARTTSEYNNQAIANYFGNYLRFKYTPGNGSSVLPLFTTLNSNLSQNSKGHRVYFYKEPITGTTSSAPDLSKAYFTGYIGKIEPEENNTQITTQDNSTIDIKVHLLDVDYINSGITGQSTEDLTNTISSSKLYHYNEDTRLSTPLLSVTAATNPFTVSFDANTSSGTITKINGFDLSDKSLIYRANGLAASTVVKNLDTLEYTHPVFVGFQVSPSTTQQPEILLNRGVDFNWCLGNGTSPNGVDLPLDITDGYYIVTSSTNINLPSASMVKIVGDSTSVPTTGLKITAVLSADGDRVRFTSNLPYGGYYLVGKAKHRSTNISITPNQEMIGKMRVKTSTTTSEVINNNSANLNTIRRIIKNNSAGTPYEIYFNLSKADVWKINSITDGSGADISNRFIFDTAQTDQKYELSRLYVKPEYLTIYKANTTFTINANYSYFEHTGYGPLTVESYRGISYENIPVYTSPTSGQSIQLSSAIDFRFVASIAGTTLPYVTYSNGIVPERFTISTNYTAYIPRIDKLVVGRNISADDDTTTLSRIAGVPSEVPVVPEDISDSMTLFVLSVPAYTFNANDVKAERIGNSRFTMKDIGEISNRVSDLEQYAVLNELELGVVSSNLKLSSGEDAIVKAIVADTFDGHSIADVSDTNHRCSIDVERGELRASFRSEAYEYRHNTSAAGLTLTTDNILCHDFTKFATPVLSQSRVSTTVKANPFDLPNWVGNIKVTPHGDYWYDNTTRPVVKNNDDNANDAWLSGNILGSYGHGSQWNDWESIWSGISVELDDAENRKNSAFFSKPRTVSTGLNIDKKNIVVDGYDRFITSLETQKYDYISRLRKKKFYEQVATSTILNKSVVPLMRGDKTLTFNVYNMKPNTTVHVFFDNINVNQYCTVNGSTGPFTTDSSNGSILNVVFDVPANMFEVGNKILRVIDSADNIVENATTIAETTYRASGLKDDESYGVLSIRQPEIRKQTPNSNKVVSNPLYRDKSINTAKYNQWIDPLAQTFEISQNFYPNGLYLESVDLFFATKDSSLPVTVEIHPVVNGLPHPSVVLPFSTVVKNPSSVTTNNSTPTATNFKFSTPVYLAPGRYAMMVRCNSSDYSLFAANIGDFDLLTNERISSTFNGGVLFKPQNSVEPAGDSNIDLMFNLNRCQFSSPAGDIDLQNYYGGSDDNAVVNLIQPNPAIFAPSGVSVTTKVALGATEMSVVPNRNMALVSPYQVSAANQLNIKVATTTTTPTLLSPMIDMDMTNTIVVENVIDSSNSTTEELTPTSGASNSSVARYISKKITLPSGESATELKVILDLNKPAGTFIAVYGKVSDSTLNAGYNSSDRYVLMSIDGANAFQTGNQSTNSQSEFDFREMMYKMTSTKEFDTFSVKICMYSTSSGSVPKIKNLRVVAVE